MSQQTPPIAASFEPVAVAPASSRLARRGVGALIALGAGTVLMLAAVLKPADAGLGTHEQLNLPPCTWIVLMDVPCPTCGMTTSFTHAADGHFLASLRAQPLGFLLSLATAMALLVGVYVAATGSPLLGLMAKRFTARAGWTLGGLALAAWLYKVIAYREFLP